MSKVTSRWNSSLNFIFAASAAAIGLGNILRFPFMVGENGGSAFVVSYIACILIIGISLVLAEIVLGRLSRMNPPAAFKTLAIQSNASKHWSWVGILSILTSFLVLTYYVVISAWVLDYLLLALKGSFHATNAQQDTQLFKQLKNSGPRMIIADSVVIITCIGVLCLGLKNGLERAVKPLFPAMLILLLLLLFYATTTDKFLFSVHYLFDFQWNHLTGHTLLLALGQAFFSLGIGFGVTIMLSAYLPTKTSLINSTISIIIADTAFALLAGMIIFPIVFSNHLQPNAGPGLIFETLPIAFAHMPFGQLIGVLFFFMLFFAAFSSIIGVMEPCIEWLAAKLQSTRQVAVITLSIAVWLVNLLVIGSFLHPHEWSLHGFSLFDIIDFVSASIFLPLSGLFLSLFTGWKLKKALISQELQWNIQSIWYRIWLFVLRFIAPLAILIIFIHSLNII